MRDETQLDAAFRAQGTGDPAAERRFHERVLDAELFLALVTEPERDDERLAPLIFDLEEGRFALAFDRDDRLAEFLEGPAPYAAMPGRRLVAALAGQGIGLGLNLGAPSAVLLPGDAIDWLAALAEAVPVALEARLGRLGPPSLAPPDLIAALGAKLAAMAEVIDEALLAGAEAEGRPVLLLALAGVPSAAQAGVAAAVAETVRFSGEGAAVDVSFIEAEGTLAAIRPVALRFELPRHQPPAPKPKPPGMDPSRPPILRR